MIGKPPVWRFIMIYKRGEIVLVNFPMPDLQLYKPRPALIVQSDKNNTRLRNLIFLQITSNLSHKFEETQFLVKLNSEEGTSSGLLADSVIKAESIFTLPKTFVYKKLGSLPENAMKKVDLCIKKSLSIK